MKFRLLTRKLRAKHVAKSWKKVYIHPHTKQWKHEVFLLMYEKILKLGKSPDPDDIDKIITNNSWTNLVCNFCGTEYNKVIEIQRNRKSMNICKDCIDKITKEGKKL